MTFYVLSEIPDGGKMIKISHRSLSYQYRRLNLNKFFYKKNLIHKCLKQETQF